MERMFSGHSLHFLENDHLLFPSKCGFHSFWYALDHLVSLETFTGMVSFGVIMFCQYSLIWKEAHDTTQNLGIMQDFTICEAGNDSESRFEVALAF